MKMVKYPKFQRLQRRRILNMDNCTVANRK